MTLALLLAAVLLLSWSNGANDNFKGVATLYGSGAASFRGARLWATATTFVGSLVSVALARRLAVAFSGTGLIPAELIDPPMLAAIGSAAALTILAATLLGMPTSTTHALTGALVGSALAAAALASAPSAAGPGSLAGVDWERLMNRFAQPLLVSPLLAIAATALLYPTLRRLRLALGVERRTCVCIGDGEPVPLPTAAQAAALAPGRPALEIAVGESARCVERYGGRLLGLEAQRAVDAVHFLSAGAVCFARAVNDTPKVAALLLAFAALGSATYTPGILLAVAVAMAAGGWLQSRKVAETMSRRITDLNPGQGLTANLVTAGLVLGASHLGVPVSTTHVSCGSIFGIGLANRRADGRTVRQILATWLTTLPLAFVLGAVILLALRAIG